MQACPAAFLFGVAVHKALLPFCVVSILDVAAIYYSLLSFLQASDMLRHL
jgi:hypothetical protein